MKIRLVSRSGLLRDLCREVLANIHGRWEFVVAESPYGVRSEGLILWDFAPEMPLPEISDFREGLKNIFLVERKDLMAFRDRLAGIVPLIVLKPVDANVLRELMERLMAMHPGQQPLEEQAGRLRWERDQMLQSLLHCNLKLQEYAQERRQFLEHCIHAFDEPLMAVRGYCELLLDPKLGPVSDERARVLQRMQHSVQRLSRLLAAVTQVSADRQRKPDLQFGDIESCITKALFETRRVAESRRLTVVTQIAGPDQPLLFDPFQIEEVLVYLLEQACRRSPRTGFVQVKAGPLFWNRRCAHLTEDVQHLDRRSLCSESANAYRVEVSDSGFRFVVDDHEHVHSERGSGVSDNNASLAGLDLVVCREIMKLHQGRVYAEGHGTARTAGFVLPYAKAAGPITDRVSMSGAAGAESVDYPKQG